MSLGDWFDPHKNAFDVVFHTHTADVIMHHPMTILKVVGAIVLVRVIAGIFGGGGGGGSSSGGSGTSSFPDVSGDFTIKDARYPYK